MNVTESVKILLQIKDAEWDGIIGVHYDILEQLILNHINRTEFPVELLPVIVNRIVLHMRFDIPEFQSVQTTKNGATSITFNTTPMTNDALNSIMTQLNGFRRLKWRTKE